MLLRVIYRLISPNAPFIFWGTRTQKIVLIKKYLHEHNITLAIIAQSLRSECSYIIQETL